VFAPVVEMLRSLAAALATSFADLVGVASRGVAALVPDLVEDEPRVSAAGNERVFDALSQVLNRASDIAPLVVVLEDLHWADRATLDLIRYLTLTLGPARVLAPLTVRDEELRRSARFGAWLEELARVRHVEVVGLTPLSLLESAELVASLGGDSAVLDSVPSSTPGPGTTRSSWSSWWATRQPGLPDRIRDILVARDAERNRQPRQRRRRSQTPRQPVWRRPHAPNVAELRTRRPYKPDTLAATNPVDPVACRTPEIGTVRRTSIGTVSARRLFPVVSQADPLTATHRSSRTAPFRSWFPSDHVAVSTKGASK
jgi:hypothetical protein